MFERLKNNRRLLLVLLATLITQGLIFLLVYNVNLIPSWEIGCAVVCVIIYLAIGYVYFITLRRIFRWLIKGIKKWYAVSLSLLYSLLMYGWLVAGLFFTFCAAPLHMGIIWLQILHVPRGVFGVILAFKFPRSHEVIEAIPLDKKSYSIDSLKE